MGGEAKGKSSKNDKIAIVYIVGAITSGESAMSFFGGETVGSDTIVQGAAPGRGRRQGERHRAARRQPRRIGTGQRPDLARSGEIEKAGRGQHGRRRGQRRLLHLDGREKDLRRARHAHRLDRRGRRQAGVARAVRQDRRQHRSDQPRQEQPARFRSPIGFTPDEREALETADARHLPAVHHQGRRRPQTGSGQAGNAGQRAASSPDAWPWPTAWPISSARSTTP